MNFKEFLNTLKNNENSFLIESIKSGFIEIFESLSTDDANGKPMGSVLKYVEPAAVLAGNTEKESEEYFPRTLSADKLDIVQQSKFGLGRQSKYPAPGRGIVSNDPGTNQYGASQNANTD